MSKDYKFTPTFKKGIGDLIEINDDVYTIALAENDKLILLREEEPRVRIVKDKDDGGWKTYEIFY